MGIREKRVIVLITIVAIMAVPDTIQHFNKRISWDKYSTEGRRLILFGDTDKAVQFYKAEVKNTILKHGARSAEYIAALEGLAMAYQKQDMFLSAEDQFNEALVQLDKSWLPDRDRMRETMGLMAEMYDKRGEHGKLQQIQLRERSLNPWWQWFWSCFFVTFIAEAMYMAVVLTRPGDIELSHLKVEHGWLYVFACLVGTVGMFRGFVMGGTDILLSFFFALGITMSALPFVFAGTLMFARQFGQEDSRRFIEAPTSKRPRQA